MIPDFKTYIGESVWADIHKRSNGSQERKEDDIDLMNSEELGEYIKKNYITNSPFDIVFDKNFDDGCLIITIYKWRNKYCYFRLRKKDGINHVELTDLYNKNMQELVSGYYYLYDDFEKEIYEIFPKDVERIGGLFPHYDKISNSFFIEVLDFLIKIADNSHIPQIRKKEKTFESVWADIHRRSNGSKDRKEDDIDLMDFEDFYQYIQIKYEAKDEKCPIAGRLQLQNMDIVEVFTPIEKIGNFYKSLVFEYNKKTHEYVKIRSPKTLYEEYPNLERFLDTNYVLKDIGKSILIYPKKGKITNQTVIDLVNIFLVNSDNPLLKKNS